MKRQLILGVDPGFKGALALYNPIQKTCISIKDTPLLPKQKNEIDLFQLAQFISIYANEIKFAVIERVSAMTYVDRHGEVRGQGARASFEFGRTVGVMQGMIASYNIPVVLVHPAAWKSAMGLSSDKQQSLTKAAKMFPLYRSYFIRKKDDGRAEAILLAVFASNFTGGRLYDSPN